MFENGSSVNLDPTNVGYRLDGLYSRPAGNVYFAGEHTDSFYSYLGCMEGALLSGARAADEVLRGS